MFYSQFILAKKGPLGTIWIAAHLERKLRKNQVADTDIGVSVDSILFPEVPIALRLSSHLLLGVVRIYSRKVNYLFHDCSEALLKIKQAFRSTAVDLPPEESTAPYHSITLPETFDLDDFELPDSAFLQGNYVDHHISTREQITLQDPMDTTEYTTSQFGLDERFGDGDASHIRLELDEELFMDKNASPHHDTFPFGSEEGETHQGQSSILQDNMDTDGQNVCDEHDRSETLQDLSKNHAISSMEILKMNNHSSHEHGYNIQTPDLNEVFLPNDHIDGSNADPNRDNFAADGAPSPDMYDCSHAPSTPGLLQEAIPANFQEIPALSPREKVSSSNVVEVVNSDSYITVAAQCSDGLLAAPSELHQEHGQRSEDELLNGLIEGNNGTNLEIPVQITTNDSTTFEVSSDNALISGVALELNSSSYENKSEPLIVSTQDHLEDADASLNSNTSAFTSGSYLRHCSSGLNEANMLSSEDVGSVDIHPEYPHKEPGCISETPLVEEALCLGKPFGEMQGQDNITVNISVDATDTTQELKSGVNDVDEVLTDTISKDFQMDHLNIPLSSEYPVPEKMLLAPFGDVGPPNDLGNLTAEKVVVESVGSVERISSLCGQKRHLTGSTPVLQDRSSGKMSGLPRGRRKAAYIPDDDDILASILVGRSPLLRMGPTPLHPRGAGHKRPRLTQRAGVPKRKVLIDDTMVLHADAIRQQLINTEDIRRMRKKAPCTRPEIWIIQISSMEEEVFNESLLTGISAKLKSLHARRYDTNGKINSQTDVDERHAYDELVKELEYSKESNGKEIGVPFGQSVSIEAQSCRDAAEFDNQDKLESSRPFQPDPSINNETIPVSGVDTDANDIEKSEFPFPSPPSVSDGIQTNSIILETSIRESIQLSEKLTEMGDGTLDFSGSASVDGFASAENTTECRIDSILEGGNSVDMVNLNCIQHCHSDVREIDNGETLVSMLDSRLLEDGGGLPSDYPKIIGHESYPTQDIILENSQPTDQSTIIPVPEIAGMEKIGLDVTIEDELVAERVLADEEMPKPDIICTETPQLVSSVTGNENVPSAVGENSGLQECHLDGGLDVESAPMDIADARDSSDFCSGIVGNDTEFLNIDDVAEFDEEADDDIPNPEEVHSLENTGWSSRTRGVARYLKGLFDEESGRGRKTIAIDHLLAGKTRKEASRMFFETLVLKTRDYIHVEQENPLDRINVIPRAKLLKSEF